MLPIENHDHGIRQEETYRASQSKVENFPLSGERLYLPWNRLTGVVREFSLTDFEEKHPTIARRLARIRVWFLKFALHRTRQLALLVVDVE